MCLTTKTLIDAETETLIPTHGGGFDVATLDGLETARTLTKRYDGSPCHDRGPDVIAFAHQQGGSINMHTSEETALTLQRTQTQALAYGFKAGQGSKAKGIGWQEEIAPTLGATESGNQRSPGLLQASAVRRLTPRECERLQGFSDDYTLIPWRGKPADQCPDGPRYKALGNSMAVPVMRWIGERIQMVESIQRERQAA